MKVKHPEFEVTKMVAIPPPGPEDSTKGHEPWSQSALNAAHFPARLPDLQGISRGESIKVLSNYFASRVAPGQSVSLILGGDKPFALQARFLIVDQIRNVAVFSDPGSVDVLSIPLQDISRITRIWGPAHDAPFGPRVTARIKQALEGFDLGRDSMAEAVKFIGLGWVSAKCIKVNFVPSGVKEGIVTDFDQDALRGKFSISEGNKVIDFQIAMVRGQVRYMDLCAFGRPEQYDAAQAAKLNLARLRGTSFNDEFAINTFAQVSPKDIPMRFFIRAIRANPKLADIMLYHHTGPGGEYEIDSARARCIMKSDYCFRHHDLADGETLPLSLAHMRKAQSAYLLLRSKVELPYESLLELASINRSAGIAILAFRPEVVRQGHRLRDKIAEVTGYSNRLISNLLDSESKVKMPRRLSDFLPADRALFSTKTGESIAVLIKNVRNLAPRQRGLL